MVRRSDQLRQERRFVQSLYEEAKRTQAAESVAIIRAWLPRSRARINLFSAQKTRPEGGLLDLANDAPGKPQLSSISSSTLIMRSEFQFNTSFGPTPLLGHHDSGGPGVR